MNKNVMNFAVAMAGVMAGIYAADRFMGSSSSFLGTRHWRRASQRCRCTDPQTGAVIGYADCHGYPSCAECCNDYWITGGAVTDKRG